MRTSGWVTFGVVKKFCVFQSSVFFEEYPAVALVHHVLLYALHRTEILAPVITVQAHVIHTHFLTEIGNESFKIDEVVQVGDKEAMLHAHVSEVLFHGVARMRTEDTLGEFQRFMLWIFIS